MVELWNSIPTNLSLAEKVDILVSPDHAGHVKQYLQCSGIVPEVIIKDLQSDIDQENVATAVEDEGLELRPGEQWFAYFDQFKAKN